MWRQPRADQAIAWDASGLLLVGGIFILDEAGMRRQPRADHAIAWDTCFVIPCDTHT